MKWTVLAVIWERAVFSAQLRPTEKPPRYHKVKLQLPEYLSTLFYLIKHRTSLPLAMVGNTATVASSIMISSLCIFYSKSKVLR